MPVEAVTGQSAPMSTDTPTGAADFAAFVARYHTDVALRKMHFARLFLGLGAACLVVLVIGTEFRLRLFADDGGVMLVVLIPTLLLIIHGLGEAPTRARLAQLYARLGSTGVQA